MRGGSALVFRRLGMGMGVCVMGRGWIIFFFFGILFFFIFFHLFRLPIVSSTFFSFFFPFLFKQGCSPRRIHFPGETKTPRMGLSRTYYHAVIPQARSKAFGRKLPIPLRTGLRWPWTIILGVHNPQRPC